MTSIVNSVLYGADLDVAEWVMARVPTNTRRTPQDMLCALGVVRDRRLVAGLIFHEFVKGVNIEITVAADSARWCMPVTLRQLFLYPFVQLGVPRITCRTSIKNKRCRRLVTGLGWKLEGTIRRAFDGRHDLVVYGLLQHECRFLRTRDEQRRPISAAAA